MADERQTFGTYISDTRKKMGLSQKQLAELIEREEGGAISPQYLNDIEHDRRSPSYDHMIQEFARVLKVGADYLYYLAGRVPSDVREANLTPKKVEESFAVFRRTAPPRRKG
jgi:transcriptional regulator with XRE-family HTH domain